MSIFPSISGLFQSAALNPVSTKALSVMNSTGMDGVVFRDSMVNNAVAAQDRKRDKYQGDEMWRTMWGTTMIWGFGVQASNMAFDWVAGKLGRPFANASIDRLKDTNFTTEMHQFGTAAQHAAQTNPIFKDLGHKALGMVKNISPEALINAHQAMGVGRVLVAGVAPAIALGWIFPPLNRALTLEKIAQDRANLKSMPIEQARADIKHEYEVSVRAKTHQPENKQSSGFNALSTPQKMGVMSLGMGAAGVGAFALSPHIKPAVSHLVQEMNSNEVLTNLIGVDSVITGGRVLKSDTAAERNEWMIQEGLFIGMAYFAAPWLNDTLRNSLGRLDPASSALLGMNFESLRELSKRYHPKKDMDQKDQFSKDLFKSAENLGLDMSGTIHDVAERLLAKNKDGSLEKSIKDAMMPNVYQYGDNVILDMAIQSGHIPVIRRGIFDSKVLSYNPAQAFAQAQQLHAPKLNMGQSIKKAIGLYHEESGILMKMGKKIIGNPETLEGGIINLLHVAQSEKPLSRLMNGSMASKMVALGVSLAANYYVLGVLSPQLRCANTKKATGNENPDWLPKP